jgi:hypothetical protein
MTMTEILVALARAKDNRLAAACDRAAYEAEVARLHSEAHDIASGQFENCPVCGYQG